MLRLLKMLVLPLGALARWRRTVLDAPAGPGAAQSAEALLCGGWQCCQVRQA